MNGRICSQPLQRNTHALEAARKEFEELYARITSDKSAAAMRKMINVNSTDLAESFKSVP